MAKIDVSSYLHTVGIWVLTHTIPILVIMIGTLIVLKLVGVVSEKVGVFLGRKKDNVEYEKRAATLASVIRWVLRVTALVLAGMMLLQEFGVEIGPVIAAAGVVGLAVGFGAQNLVQDFISGFFILLEDQVRVGDVVQINNKGGLVEQITLRMVILRDEAGTVHFIRNGKIDVVSNMTKEYSHYVFNVSIAYREDVDAVIKVLQGIDEGMRNDPAFKNDILRPLEVMGLDSFGESAVVVKARTTTKPIQQWRIGREFNRRIKLKFDELDIEIPFPMRTIYMGREKDGEATALRVQTDGHLGNGESHHETQVPRQG